MRASCGPTPQRIFPAGASSMVMRASSMVMHHRPHRPAHHAWGEEPHVVKMPIHVVAIW